MDAQGCAVEDVYVYQDNQSAILLENNGMRSVGKGKRHVKIKYFFVTDKIKDNELKVICCPTEKNDWRLLYEAFTNITIC